MALRAGSIRSVVSRKHNEHSNRQRDASPVHNAQ